MKQKKAFIFIILAGLLWGSSCLFVQVLGKNGYGFASLQLTALRGILAGIVMALYTLLTDRSAFRVKLRWLPIFALHGTCLFMTAFFYYSAMPLTGTPTAVILMYLSTVFVIVFSVAVWKEKMTPLKLFAIACMLIGCCLVSGIVSGLNFHPIGVVFGILSAISYTGSNLLVKLSTRHGQSPVSITLYGFLTMSVISLFFVEPTTTLPIIASDPVKVLPLIFGMGLCTFIIPYFLFTLSLQELPGGTVASLGVVEPMAATVYSVVFLHEAITVYSAIGVLLVLVAVVLLGKTENTKVADLTPERK